MSSHRPPVLHAIRGGVFDIEYNILDFTAVDDEGKQVRYVIEGADWRIYSTHHDYPPGYWPPLPGRRGSSRAR